MAGLTADRIKAVASAGQDHTLSQAEKWRRIRAAWGFTAPRTRLTAADKKFWERAESIARQKTSATLQGPSTAPPTLAVTGEHGE